MNRIFVKITTLLMSAVVLAGGFAACASTPKDPLPPDYSESAHKMRMYGYYGPTDGTWYLNGNYHTANEDFRTVEAYKDYLDSGLNVLMLGGSYSSVYTGEDWQTSKVKMAMDNAYEAGIKEILVNDNFIRTLSATSGGVIGEGKKFATEEDLDAAVAASMAAYKDHPAFYGVLLQDEPRFAMLASIGQVYQSVKRVNPDAVAHCNLWPPAKSSIGEGNFLPPTEETDENKMLDSSWNKYLQTFVELTGANYVQYDHYPMTPTGVTAGYIRGMQSTADAAKRLGVDFYHTSQTFGLVVNNDVVHRPIEEDDAYFLSNLMLGFGVKEIAYYSYWTYPNNTTNGTYCMDGTSFITWAGKKTDLYYYMQDINSQIHKFAPVIMSFDYQGSTYFSKNPVSYANNHVVHPTYLGMQRDSLSKVLSVVPNKETVLVTELRDADKDNYMYMVQNVLDPSRGHGSTAFISTEVEFADEYTHVAVYYKGERTLHKLTDGKYTVKVKPGHAQYLMPY